MKRTSFFLDDDLLRELKRIAERRDVSVAMVVREAAAAYVARPGTTTALPSVAGQFASGHPDTASRTDELLWQDPHA